MYIILGGTGHVGSAVVKSLLDKDEKVTLITRDAEKAKVFKKKGAFIEVADVLETEKLKAIFVTGQRLFLLNPPPLPNTNTVAEEKKTLSSILKALKGSGIKKVVCESTYGAQKGDGIGDLGVLYDMEQQLHKMDLSVTVIRAAYYFSNWDTFLATAEKEGKIYSLYPADFKLPMVAPEDIGKIASKLLQEPIEKAGLHFVEGPEKYSSADVAKAFSEALGKTVNVISVPKDKWEETLMQMKFSKIAATSMSAMTENTLNEDYKVTSEPLRGDTTLYEYIKQLVLKSRQQLD